MRNHEALELTYYAGDALIHALMNWFDPTPRPFEPVGRSHRAELESYVRYRHETAAPQTIKLFDAATNRRFDFPLTTEQNLYSLSWFDLDRLFSLEYDVLRVMRNDAGKIAVLISLVPINRKTMSYLMDHPCSRLISPALQKKSLSGSPFRNIPARASLSI
ncbi:hypothetical protein [Paenibacillus sp. LPE1-1-1.1]|uniref:hypothetical protein n=1 Tax=Paenibacillus sp. LPE1-1-1.1 TaxID=3135230 RepID=UPI0034336F96